MNLESLPPWWRSFPAELQALRGAASLQTLNALARARKLTCGQGLPIVFTAPHEVATPDRLGHKKPGAEEWGSEEWGYEEWDYEQRIARMGEVITREGPGGGLHDRLNALMWLNYPHSKAALNTLHARASMARGNGPGLPGGQEKSAGRGAARDSATLWDENGLVLLYTPAAAPVIQALRSQHWHEAFFESRALWGEALLALPFGHGLLEKLERPYKAIHAYAWPLPMKTISVRAADAQLAALVQAETMTARPFFPIPVMGIPGWHVRNDAAVFYEDPSVFRAPKAP